KRQGCARELARSVCRLVLDAAALGHIAEQYAVRTGECQEHLVGCRPPARAVHDPDLRGLQEIHALHQLIDALDRIFDRKYARASRRMQREAMMGVVETDIRGLADPVAHAAVEEGGPQLLVGAVHVRSATASRPVTPASRAAK